MEEKNYCIKLHGVGRKKKQGYQGPDDVTWHFRTSAEVGSVECEEAKMEGVDKCWHQNQRWWLGYRLGTVKIEVGRKPLPVISPGYEYHKGRTFPVWEEV